MSSVLAGAPPMRSESQATAPPVPASPPSVPRPTAGPAQQHADGDRGRGRAAAGDGRRRADRARGRVQADRGARPGDQRRLRAVREHGAGAPSEAPFASDWPSGTSGYTVQLQTLPQAGTTVSAVEAAKSADERQGREGGRCAEVRRIQQPEAGSYVIYSGVYHCAAEAEKALAGLKKSFPGAKVIKVSNGGVELLRRSSGASPAGGVGSSESHPAPPSVLNEPQRGQRQEL